MKVVKMFVIVLLAIFCFLSLNADQNSKTDKRKEKDEIIILPGLEALECLDVLENLEINLDGLEALESLEVLENLDVSFEGLKGLEALKNLDILQDLDEVFEDLNDLEIDVDMDELFETPKIEKKKEKDKK